MKLFSIVRQSSRERGGDVVKVHIDKSFIDFRKSDIAVIYTILLDIAIDWQSF